jgi:hypothetical protein
MGTLTGQLRLFNPHPMHRHFPFIHFCRSHPAMSTAKYELTRVVVLQPRQMVTDA